VLKYTITDKSSSYSRRLINKASKEMANTYRDFFLQTSLLLAGICNDTKPVKGAYFIFNA